jgi:hypothetical protein
MKKEKKNTCSCFLSFDRSRKKSKQASIFELLFCFCGINDCSDEKAFKHLNQGCTTQMAGQNFFSRVQGPKLTFFTFSKYVLRE